MVLKLAEGLAESIFKSIKESLRKSLGARLSAALWAPALRKTLAQWDYSRIGGAPLLGVQGNVVMAHGRSDAGDIQNAVALALPQGAGRLGGRPRAVGVPTGPGTSQVLIDAYGIIG